MVGLLASSARGMASSLTGQLGSHMTHRVQPKTKQKPMTLKTGSQQTKSTIPKAGSLKT